MPASFASKYQEISASGSSPSSDILAHCRNELVQAVWGTLLLDEEFKSAYTEGILMTCFDGKVREVFPRVITDSSDYPER